MSVPFAMKKFTELTPLCEGVVAATGQAFAGFSGIKVNV